jgi:predicted RNase H-like nuclease
MTTFVGIDGIPGGWVAVYLSGDGRQRFAYASSAARLLSGPYERAMIDMPIGLPKRGYRQCDIEARALVGPRVFLGARWGVWAFNTLDEANRHYWKEEGAGRGISMQLFCIRDKLRELNEMQAPPRLFEAHPEMIFWRIAGRVLESKNTRGATNGSTFSNKTESDKSDDGWNSANIQASAGMTLSTPVLAPRRHATAPIPFLRAEGSQMMAYGPRFGIDAFRVLRCR